MRKPLVAALLALVALAGCTSSNTKDDSKKGTGKYAENVRTNFIDSCIKTAVKTGDGKEADYRKTCACVLGKIEERLPYDKAGANNDFQEAEKIIGEGRTLPAELSDPIDQSTADCRAKD
jgi:hypothetical protein